MACLKQLLMPFFCSPQSFLVTKATKKEIFLNEPCGLIHWVLSLPLHYCFPSELANYSEHSPNWALPTLTSAITAAWFLRWVTSSSVSFQPPEYVSFKLKLDKTNWLCWTSEQHRVQQPSSFSLEGKGGRPRGAKTVLVTQLEVTMERARRLWSSVDRGFFDMQFGPSLVEVKGSFHF